MNDSRSGKISEANTIPWSSGLEPAFASPSPVRDNGVDESGNDGRVD